MDSFSSSSSANNQSAMFAYEFNGIKTYFLSFPPNVHPVDEVTDEDVAKFVCSQAKTVSAPLSNNVQWFSFDEDSATWDF